MNQNKKNLVMNRRTFVKMAGAAVGFIALGRYTDFSGLASAAAVDPTTLTKYLDALPIPGSLDGTGGGPLNITMDEHLSAHTFHSSLSPAATTWGYGGAPYLGPTIKAKKGVPLELKFTNNIPDSPHPSGAVENSFLDLIEQTYPVRLMPHLHGGFTAPQFDGHPMAWFTKSGIHGENYYSKFGALANETILEYSNQQNAANIWYHDHGMGITRLNVYMGLAAEYFIRDEHDTGIEGEGLNIPKGDFEVPVVIQDRKLDANGSLIYPIRDTNDCFNTIWIPEFFGDIAVVNGKAWPKKDVEPRRYRLRLLNGSNARFYQLRFQREDTGATIPFYLIGTDGGLISKPTKLNTILLSPAERADVIVDFTSLPNKRVKLTNNAPAPYPMGGDLDLPEIMRFDVLANRTVPDTTDLPSAIANWPAFQSVIPSSYSWLTAVPATGVNAVRDIVLKEKTEFCSLGEVPLKVLLNNKQFRDATDEIPTEGNVEVWQYINLTPDAHPMHVHLVQFEVLNRQYFNNARYFTDWQAWLATPADPATPKPVLGNYLFGRPIRPLAEERGYKDTAKAFPAQVLRVIAKFDIPPGSLLLKDYAPGAMVGDQNNYNYVHHCHIIEHEDNEMMRPFSVVPLLPPPA